MMIRFRRKTSRHIWSRRARSPGVRWKDILVLVLMSDGFVAMTTITTTTISAVYCPCPSSCSCTSTHIHIHTHTHTRTHFRTSTSLSRLQASSKSKASTSNSPLNTRYASRTRCDIPAASCITQRAMTRISTCVPSTMATRILIPNTSISTAVSSHRPTHTHTYAPARGKSGIRLHRNNRQYRYRSRCRGVIMRWRSPWWNRSEKRIWISGRAIYKRLLVHTSFHAYTHTH